MFGWLRGKDPMDAPHPVTLPEAIKPKVDSLLREGNGTNAPAVKFVREQTGLDLVDAAVIVRRRAEEIF